MNIWAKLKLPAFAALVLILASYVVFLEVEASDQSDEVIGPSAVWQPSPQELAVVAKACPNHGVEYSHCFLEQMSNSGASDEAISFAQGYTELNDGKVAFLADFHPIDAVDLGYAVLPSSGDFNPRWLLLNGVPQLIDVDDLTLLPQTEMRKNPAYLALHRRFPHVTLFKGERVMNAMPLSEALSDGGQRFTVEYPLKDGCRSCTALGQASFSFNFDVTGRLTQVKFLKITPRQSRSPQPTS